MTRIPYPELSEEQKQALAKNPLNLTHMMFHIPPKLRAGISQMGRALLWDSEYDTRLRELVILRVGYLSKSAYEEHQHRAYGAQVGLSQEKIEAALSEAIGPPLDDKEQAVLKFAEEAILNVRPSDEALAAARQFLSDSEIMETLVIIGNYMMIARIIATADLEIDKEGVIVSNPDRK